MRFISFLAGLYVVLLFCVILTYPFRRQGRRRFVVDFSVEDDVFFELVQPSSLNYLYRLRPAKDFGLTLNRTYPHIELVISQPLHACTQLTNSIYVSGNIALVERGDCSFMSKTLMAHDAGAVAVIVMDNDHSNSEAMVDMIDDGTGRPVDIAAYFMLGKDGQGGPEEEFEADQ